MKAAERRRPGAPALACTGDPHQHLSCPRRVRAGLQTCSLCRRPPERVSLTEPGRREKAGWSRRSGSAQLWSFRPWSAASSAAAGCTEPSGGSSSLLARLLPLPRSRRGRRFPSRAAEASPVPSAPHIVCLILPLPPLGERSMSFSTRTTLGPVKEVHFVFLRLPGNCCSYAKPMRTVR